MKQRLIVRTADRRLYIEELLKLGKLGAVLAPNSVPHMGIPFSAELVVEVQSGKEFQSTPTVHALPLPITTYSKDVMEAMVWDDFREACNKLGVKGRERAVMLEEYLRKAAHYNTNMR